MRGVIKYSGVGVMVWLMLWSTVGCANTTEPMERIQIFQAHDRPDIPTAGSLADSEKDPMPSVVQEYSSSDRIFIGFRLSKDLTEPVAFTRYTFFNIETLAEFEVGIPEQLGPFDPGQIPLVAFDNPWILPTEMGHYELRVYLDNRVVSRALIDIVE